MLTGRLRGLAAAGATFIATVLAVSSSPVAAAARPPVQDPAAAALSWSPCAEAGFQCSEAQVPLDYGQPHGATIGLSLIRLPASSSTQRLGSLFLNPGGPGGSGVDFARGIARTLPAELRARFDIVGFDPRGIGRSSPLRCYDTLRQAIADLPPQPFPLTAQQEQLQHSADRKLTAACAQHAGPILEHMSTADVARDLDVLRRAVGDAGLTYLGYSYGSVLGQTYANLFPGRVRAVVIDGVVDPVAWSTGRGGAGTEVPFSTRIHSWAGAQQTLQEFFRLCDQAGAACAFSGHSADRFAALADRLRKQPLEFVDPGSGQRVTVTQNLMIAVTLGSLYNAEAFPSLAGLLAAVEAQAQPSALVAALAALQSRLDAAPGAAQRPYSNVVEGSPGVACSDTVNPARFSAWQDAADRSARSSWFGRVWTWTWSPCQSWPQGAGQDRYLGPWTARTAQPVLVVGNYFDPATRYEGAVTAAVLLPNSRLLSYAGWGHAVSFLVRNACIDRSVTRYLLTTAPPPAGTACQPEGSPFEARPEVTSEAGSTSQAAAAWLVPESLKRALRQLTPTTSSP